MTITVNFYNGLGEEPYCIYHMDNVYDYSLRDCPWVHAGLNLYAIQFKVDTYGKYIKLYLDDDGNVIQYIEVIKIEDH